MLIDVIGREDARIHANIESKSRPGLAVAS
jgi:hypothetical protein